MCVSVHFGYSRDEFRIRVVSWKPRCRIGWVSPASCVSECVCVCVCAPSVSEQCVVLWLQAQLRVRCGSVAAKASGHL